MMTTLLTNGGAMKRRERAAIVLLLGAALGGCFEHETWDDRGADLTDPFTIGDGFAQVDRERGDLWSLSVTDGQLDTRVFAFGDSFHSVRPIGENDALVLTAEPPTLRRVELGGDGRTTVTELPAGYDRVTVSEDGRFAIAHFDPDGQGTDDAILFSPNQITIVDYADPASPTSVDVILSDRTPERYVFSPPLTFGNPDEVHRFAVAIAPGSVSLVDLDTGAVTDRQRLIPLAEPATGSTPVARQVIFSEDDPTDPFDVTMFVLASGASEIYAIELLSADPASGRLLQPAINQIAAGTAPSVMRPFEVEGREKLLVLDRLAARLVIVDVPTSATDEVPLPRTYTDALVWEQVEDGAERPKAMLFSPGAATVAFLDLDTVDAGIGGAIRTLALGESAESVEEVIGEGEARAVVRYSNGTGLEVINLERRRTIAIPARAALSEFAIVGDWLFAVSRSVSRLVAVDLVDARPVEVEMDAPGTALASAGGVLLVVHDDPLGWVSVFDASSFEGGAVDEAYGFTLERLFERHR
jgi:hypothetical protein